MAATELTEGWGFPGHGQRTKAHYFVETMALCGKWGFYRGPLEADDKPSPDDCPTCRKRLNKRKAPASTPPTTEEEGR